MAFIAASILRQRAATQHYKLCSNRQFFTIFNNMKTKTSPFINGTVVRNTIKPKILLMSTEVSSSLTTKEKLKKAVKEYGSTVIIFHVTISLISLGVCYLLVSSGIDISKYMGMVGFGENTTKKFVTGAGTFMAAYAIHKVFAPVRIGITLTVTPLIVRYLRNKGILQKPIK